MNDQNPDVVLLQELNGYTEAKLAEDARSYGHAYSALLKEDGFPTGITSRYPMEDIHRIKEGFHHGLMRVKIQGIYFYVIHLHPGNWEFRNNEIDRILQDVESLPPNSEVILAGDYNNLSPLDKKYNEGNLNQGNLDYSVIQKVMDFGFTDLDARMRGSSYAFTGSFRTLIEKEGEHGDQRRLDYIFASEDLVKKVINARVVATDTSWILLDHLPVLVDLDMIK